MTLPEAQPAAGHQCRGLVVSTARVRSMESRGRMIKIYLKIQINRQTSIESPPRIDPGVCRWSIVHFRRPP